MCKSWCVFESVCLIDYYNIPFNTLKGFSIFLIWSWLSGTKYILLKKIRKNDREADIDNNLHTIESNDLLYPFPMELNDQQKKIRYAINKLGGKCKELILLFYYKRYSIEAIMHQMGYKNENTVKAHKSRCMKSLEKIVNHPST